MTVDLNKLEAAAKAALAHIYDDPDHSEKYHLAVIVAALKEAEARGYQRAKEHAARYPAWLDEIDSKLLIQMHDHIHTIMDERAGGKISEERRRKATAIRNMKDDADG